MNEKREQKCFTLKENEGSITAIVDRTKRSTFPNFFRKIKEFGVF